MLGRNSNPDESRVIAHDNVLQHIRNGGTENNGLHFAPEEDAMAVQLGVVCTGTVSLKERLNKVDEIQHAGQMHYQYNTIFSCRMKVMKERTVQRNRRGELLLTMMLEQSAKKMIPMDMMTTMMKRCRLLEVGKT